MEQKDSARIDDPGRVFCCHSGGGDGTTFRTHWRTWDRATPEVVVAAIRRAEYAAAGFQVIDAGVPGGSASGCISTTPYPICSR
jgi:hypothetical protein